MAGSCDCVFFSFVLLNGHGLNGIELNLNLNWDCSWYVYDVVGEVEMNGRNKNVVVAVSDVDGGGRSIDR